MTVFRAHFDGQVLVPDGPVDLPTGCVLEVRAAALPSNQGPSNQGPSNQGPSNQVSSDESRDLPLKRLVDAVGQFPDNPNAPVDGAEHHDHYLYGTPKRP